MCTLTGNPLPGAAGGAVIAGAEAGILPENAGKVLRAVKLQLRGNGGNILLPFPQGAAGRGDAGGKIPVHHAVTMHPAEGRAQAAFVFDELLPR